MIYNLRIKKFVNEHINSLSQVKRKLCGECLGHGVNREVFVLKGHDNLVVKIEWRDQSFGNIMEWSNYHHQKYWTWLGPWLAECYDISKSGRVMIQRRVFRPENKLYPKVIPSVLTDIKKSNFGFTSDGKFVACDYQYLLVGVPQKMVKAKFRDG